MTAKQNQIAVSIAKTTSSISYPMPFKEMVCNDLSGNLNALEGELNERTLQLNLSGKTESPICCTGRY